LYFKSSCLMKSGVPLEDSVCDLIEGAAREMILKGEKTCRLKSKEVEALISTDFKEVCVGSHLSGISCLATAETSRGKTKIQFVVKPDVPKDYNENSFWMSYMEGDQARRAARAIYN